MECGEVLYALLQNNHPKFHSLQVDDECGICDDHMGNLGASTHMWLLAQSRMLATVMHRCFLLRAFVFGWGFRKITDMHINLRIL